MIFMSFACLVSGFSCLYKTAFQEFYSFGTSQKFSGIVYAFVIVDSLFLIDMILMFFHEYNTEDRYHPIRNPYLIAKNYFFNDYLEHLVALIPFNLLIDPLTEVQRINEYHYICLLFLLKSLRMKRGF